MEEPLTQSFLYETLPALKQSPPPPDDLEPYSVFRNEITLSTSQCAPVDTAAPDFFSLDVAADEPDPILSSSSSVRLAEPWTPLHQSEPTTPALEVEPKLESGWFRGHCKFKSPMLQLHKEIVDFCDFLSPTPEEQESRSAAVQRVSDLIKYIFPRSKVEVFGSFKTGLHLPASDIDASKAADFIQARVELAMSYRRLYMQHIKTCSARVEISQKAMGLEESRFMGRNLQMRAST
ncbi:poly(A) RNA polymerase protein 2-like [Pyrus communis]|uniref:poly(A) RNA polymerase protein 2-like n=1 Tax=Pyrus communis TaxID=23211 RepID=UPI0035C1D9AC